MEVNDVPRHVIAGLLIKWACDIDAKVASVYRANFDVPHFLSSAEDLHLLTDNLHVNILHFSLPCKFWSPAHTHETNVERDGANRASLFIVLVVLIWR